MVVVLAFEVRVVVVVCVLGLLVLVVALAGIVIIAVVIIIINIRAEPWFGSVRMSAGVTPASTYGFRPQRSKRWPGECLVVDSTCTMLASECFIVVQRCVRIYVCRRQ